MKRPRYADVGRRFKAGESIGHISATVPCRAKWTGCAPLPGIAPHFHLRETGLDPRRVEDALRRSILRAEGSRA